MRNLPAILFFSALLISCKTNELYLNVTQPAPVTLLSGIKKVGIINRSVPTDATSIVDALDRILTLEGAELDCDGAWESIAGLTEELKANERFTEVKELKDINFKASRIGVLPPPLSPRLVDSLCAETGTEALFSLERFDTDTRVGFGKTPGSIETALGKIPLRGLEVSMETIIKSGWRIYAPAVSGILDEIAFAESLVFTAKGLNPVAAVEALTGRKEAIREVSRNAGHTYAIRLLPYRIRVSRDYFVKGTDNFKIAKRKARTGKWDEAGSLWEKEVSNPKMKIAGRACYNMAIINEINGSLDEALGWAQKSYEDYGIRPALKYIRILEDRKAGDELLKIQEITE